MKHAAPSARRQGRFQRSLDRFDRRHGFGRDAAVSGLATAIGLMALVGVLQWHTWTQPDREATVYLASFTGHDRNCGKACRCPEMRFTTVEPAADGTHVTGRATFKDCAHQYEIGDALTVRHYRGDPTRVDADPVPGWAVLPFGLASGTVVGAFVGLCGIVRRRYLQRRDLRRAVRTARREPRA